MPSLQIRLLGPMEFHAGQQPLDSFQTRKAKALFSYLILHRGRVIPRELVAAEFWGGLSDSRARNALNTDLWRVNRVLRDAGLKPDNYLQSDTSGITFREQADYSLDIARFNRALGGCVHTPPELASAEIIEQLKHAVSLYRGDLLQGIFDDWCLVHREQLRARYLSAMEYLMFAHMATKAWAEAADYAHKLLAVDPLQEHIHRALMRCHYLLGNRPAAMRQYTNCVQLLRRELDVEPMEETRRVYETITAITPRPAAAERQETRPEKPGRARRPPLEEVNLALANLETARGWLIDAGDQLREGSGSG